ncbi:MAG: HTH domain-containing protein [Methyloprofundus sp.]|nr:HTH domain-containing protein [Methyloprofundus sp.]
MQNSTGSRQKQILALLLATKAGLSIDSIAEKLQISRNAVKQHMVVLEKDLLIKAGKFNLTKGRPSRSYVLTEQGINQFTKQYSWFCNLLIAQLKEDMGSEGLTAFMQRLGGKIADSLAAQFTGQNASEKAQTLTMILQNLGYQAEVELQGDMVTISAINCVFHDLAQEHGELCEFDRSLIRSLLDNPVEQTECMAKQGCACRFASKV